jgi:transcriptional regulator with XRE-family HTH domain
MVGSLSHKIREIQVKKGLSDREMAEKLGCSRQLYQMARTGKIPLRHKILKGISLAFPELQGDILIFLSTNVTNQAEQVTNDTTGIRS